MSEEKLLDVTGAAQYLSVSNAWLRDHITRKEPIVPHLRMGGMVRFRISDLRGFMEKSLVRERPGRRRSRKPAA